MSESICTAVIGIVGTLAGTVLGWLLNNVSRRGKLRAFVAKWDEDYKFNDVGSMVGAPSYDEAECYFYELTLDVYNSSSDTKIMRDFKMEFLKGRKIVASKVPLNADNRGSGLCKTMGTLNVAPKSVVSVHLVGGFWRSNFAQFDEINSSSKVRLSYKGEGRADRHFFIDAIKGEARFDKIERSRKRS